MTFISPMLAKESDASFDSEEWIFEIKWDGYRAIAECGKTTKLYSRNGNSFEYAYPVVFARLQKMKERMVLDGEIIVLNDEDQPDFQLLQHYESNTDRPIQYYVFDILELKGKSLVDLPLLERKKILKKVLKTNEVIKYSDHIVGEGKAFFDEIRKRNMEGVMAKKADSYYYTGKRTAEWLKIKHNKTLEAIIAGYTEPSGSRKYFGALVLGMMKGKELKYVGHTGSGFNQEMLREIYDLLQSMVQSNSPFKEMVKTNMPVTWVKPKRVCEIKYTELTRDGILRHPIFLHLREDKNIKEATMASSKSFKPKITHADKLYFPDDEITKGDVVDYYISMANYILPYLKGRPESLFRNPDGIKEKGFFHKDAGAETPGFVHTKNLYSGSVKRNIDYIICDNKATLTYMNNLGCIEINPWHSTIKNLDNPDYMIIDIDPSPKNTFEQVIDAAKAVKEVLDKAGAPSYCKTSGSTGLHVYVPTAKKYSYEQVKDFAHVVCMLVSEQLQGFTTLERNLKKRGNKHIYLDYLQNARGQTIASVYSLRPKPGATVSMPLLWKEVKRGLTPQDFTIHNALKRVKKMGDIFKPVLGRGVDLEKSLKKLG